MTLEYSAADDSVVEWHDDTPPARLCPGCGEYCRAGDFWRRPSYKMYRFSMKRDPGELANPDRPPPVDSTKCFRCNGERKIKDKTLAELERAVAARLLSPGRLIVEQVRREKEREKNKGKGARVRWGKVRALPWALARKRLATHVNRCQVRRHYYDTGAYPLIARFFMEYTNTLQDHVLPLMDASAQDGAKVDPDLTWEQFIPTLIWDELQMLWRKLCEMDPRAMKIKPPYLLLRSAPSCYVFEDDDIPYDVRKVRVK